MAREGGLAHEVRAGLDSSSNGMNPANGKKPVMTRIEGGAQSKGPKSFLDRYSYGKPARQHVKEFGVLFAAIAFALGAYLCYSGKPLSTVYILSAFGAVLATLGYTAPVVLYPFWKAWMTFAHYLGMVMTVVILFAAWVTVVLPIAAVLRICRKDVMDMRFRADAKTYWITPNEEKATDFKLLERQF